MADLRRIVRLNLSKIKFACGFTPYIDRGLHGTFKYIPSGKKAVCLISADFEMAWAFRYLQDENDARDPQRMANLTRENIPSILDDCDRYQIPITWATVGHLFLDSCDEVDGVIHPEIPRPPYYTNPYWAYNRGDWFDADPATDVQRHPAWYAPDLIQDILERSVRHEIGCHTFSHIDASDANCPQVVFNAEIEQCIRLAAAQGIRLSSFVHPGHQLGHFDSLSKLGFTNFRSDGVSILGPPVKHGSGLWEYRNTYELTWREGWSANYHLSRLKTIILRAIKNNSLCVLWFHPSMDERFVKYVFPGFLQFLHNQSDKLSCLTHGEYAQFLNESNPGL